MTYRPTVGHGKSKYVLQKMHLIFHRYGQDVLEYMFSTKELSADGTRVNHDPMCELFPTEVVLIL